MGMAVMIDDTLLQSSLVIAVAQANPVVGDCAYNLELVRTLRVKAAEEGADLIAFSELFIAGYSPEDLVLKSSFLETCREAVEALAQDTNDGGPGIAIGAPWADDTGIYNAMILLDRGKITAIRYKYDLPNYGVFDEKRVFKQGPLPGPVDFRGIRIGLPICEDMWGDEVAECLLETGAELLIVANGSPYSHNKNERRMHVMVERVVETGLPILYVNQVGGQDELVFDGASFALNRDRSLAFQLPAFENALYLSTWQRENANGIWACEQGSFASLPQEEEANWRACVLGLRDYVNKNGFPGVVLGLSGGIDSAVCAAIAVDALGAEHVHCVMLPYQYTSSESLDDAAGCAEALGVRYDIIDIAPTVLAFNDALKPLFAGYDEDVTEENIQSRARGCILMAISNKFGSMLVTTGNKSEMSVGYATLYGDMNGGFNPIKDLYKSEVYRLAAWRNRSHPADCLGPVGEVIPANVIIKAPTAELRDNQTDQDSLPPYDILDDILHYLIECEESIDTVLAAGYDRATVKKIEHLLYTAEYKRRQSAPGVKITQKNFGRDRRYPMTNKFRDN